jgi:hypothetical protein
MMLTGDGCVNLTQFRREQQAPDTLGWDYLSCTEIVHPIGSNNVTDFFPPENWSVASTSADCLGQWSVQPIDNGIWIPTTFGYAEPNTLATSAARIIFAYGELDPWHVFAINKQNLSKELPVIMIPGGSHCADMAGSRKDDTPAMIAARRQEESILKSWMSEWSSERVHRPSRNVLFV